jgi:hypothetical protein
VSNLISPLDCVMPDISWLGCVSPWALVLVMVQQKTETSRSSTGSNQKISTEQKAIECKGMELFDLRLLSRCW